MPTTIVSNRDKSPLVSVSESSIVRRQTHQSDRRRDIIARAHDVADADIRHCKVHHPHGGHRGRHRVDGSGCAGTRSSSASLCIADRRRLPIASRRYSPAGGRRGNSPRRSAPSPVRPLAWSENGASRGRTVHPAGACSVRSPPLARPSGSPLERSPRAPSARCDAGRPPAVR